MAWKHSVTPKTFAENYRESIRVGFNWDRFLDEAWPVERVILNSRSDLSRCFMPWYIGKTGDEVAFDHPEAVPLRLTDVPKSFQILNEERKTDIQAYVETFRTHRGVVEFAVPTYALPEDQHFVLDGNHRLSALAMVSVPFEATLWNVRGPLDVDCLLDLVHWINKAKD
jgi:hypothetical protein